jgi:nitrite reductase (NADH) small subunit
VKKAKTMKQLPKWISIARCHDIPLREGRAVKVGHRDIAIFNLGDRFLAIENRCPHKGGPLADGILCGATVVCPLHASKISLDTGKALNSANASSCVETFRTRQEHGVILLELSVDSSKQEEAGREGLSSTCMEPSSLAATGESGPAI